MAINFPGNPNIGDEFAGGGFAWGWTGAAWEKVSQSSSSGDQVSTAYYEVASGLKVVEYSGEAGVYTITAISLNLNSTPTGTIKFMDSASNVITEVSLIDTDSAASSNPSSVRVKMTSPFSKLVTNLNTTSWVSIESGRQYGGSSSLNVTSYSSSQTVALASDGQAVLFGSGGGGTTGYYGNGKGAGSGYIQKFTLPAGSYSLVVGAGGAQSSNGNQSTINGITAAGGQSGSTGIGGSNRGGSNGSPGSGVQLPWFIVPGAAGQTGSPTAGGGGGGLYAGGGDGGGGSGNTNAGGGGGGGGLQSGGWGGSGYYNAEGTAPASTGGSGGGGGLIVLL